MTHTLPLITTWHTDTGVMVAITKPGEEISTCVHLPPEHAAALIDSIVESLRQLGDWQRRIAEIESAITDDSLNEDSSDDGD